MARGTNYGIMDSLAGSVSTQAQLKFLCHDCYKLMDEPPLILVYCTYIKRNLQLINAKTNILSVAITLLFNGVVERVLHGYLSIVFILKVTNVASKHISILLVVFVL